MTERRLNILSILRGTMGTCCEVKDEERISAGESRTKKTALEPKDDRAKVSRSGPGKTKNIVVKAPYPIVKDEGFQVGGGKATMKWWSKMQIRNMGRESGNAGNPREKGEVQAIQRNSIRQGRDGLVELQGRGSRRGEIGDSRDFIER